MGVQPNKLLSQITNSKTEWHNSWHQCDKGRVMFQYVPKPSRLDPINSLKRKEQVVIFRLRINHIQLNAHLSRITSNHQPTCNLCGYKDETVQHFLFDCPTLQDLRKEFLPLNPDRENTLYQSKQQLLQTYQYYQKANQRRMQVQV